MAEQAARHGRWQAVAAIGIAATLSACSEGPSGPAPVFLRGGSPGAVQESALGPPPLPPEWQAQQERQTARAAVVPRPPAGPGRHIVVRPGQSVGELARDYHVTKHAIIAANDLKPPYKIEIGQNLVIPASGSPAPAVREAALRPPALREPAVHEPASPKPAAREPARRDARPPRASDNAHAEPQIIPLDGPAAQRLPARPAETALSRKMPRDPEPEKATETHAEEAEDAPAHRLPHGGRLPWPVSGKVLASYGTGPGGGRNDGINIAAPLGTPVKAVEGGVVAYAGNELRGYGNLVLIKHPDGFITAYAHCEELLVKRGEHVNAGEVIAKVGATGGVARPQLHFELRRGEHAVDPRKFLAPRA